MARSGPCGWRGILLRGPSGAGKSDLALRLMDSGWRLVADDYTHVWSSDDALYACAPQRIAGHIEARGLGILTAGSLVLARIVLLVDCLTVPSERLPEPAFDHVAGVRLPRLAIDIRPASATVSVGLALDRL
ncbi:HPr kinase/phosphorylase [Brevundimonas sp. R86498]|uniref:HPr kinase/phosphorylase n=1 Tax=Brevundimonas sp. R86498 TaxID=3093845 RepID=UPI0037C9ECCB